MQLFYSSLWLSNISLKSMGSQRVGHDWVTELNWTEATFWLIKQYHNEHLLRLSQDFLKVTKKINFSTRTYLMLRVLIARPMCFLHSSYLSIADLVSLYSKRPPKATEHPSSGPPPCHHLSLSCCAQAGGLLCPFIKPWSFPILFWVLSIELNWVLG